MIKKSVKSNNKKNNSNKANKTINNKFEDVRQFPFWAKLKIEKHRPTLVIDETKKASKRSGKEEDCFVHREVTHTSNKNNEKIEPNPNRNDSRPMYLKRPRVLPKRLFTKYEKKMSVPQYLVDRYKKNNNK